jgi:hypothetical protein
VEKQLERRQRSTPAGCRGRAVSYEDQARDDVQHYFTWILSLTKGKGKWEEIIVQIGGLAFMVELASQIPRECEHEVLVESELT